MTFSAETSGRCRCAAAAAAALTVCALGSAHAAGTMTFCTLSAPEGFDAAQYETGGTFDAAGVALYDQLTAMRPGTTEVVPGLAESWQVSADGLVYTLKLRRGVKFHSTPWFKPTRDLNADDVMLSFGRMLDKNHPGYTAARNGFLYWASMGMPSLVQALDKLDAMTVRFTLRRPEVPFLANLSITAVGSVYSAEYFEQLRAAGKLEQFNTQPVGSGPFVFKSYQKDAVVRYTAHPVHWAGAPKIDQLVFAITTDRDVAVQRLKAGECLVSGVRAESAAALESVPELQAITHPTLLTAYVAPNHSRAPMSDKRFRRALWLAMDKAAMVRSAYGGRAVSAAGFLPPRMWGADPSLKETLNVAQAKELIKTSGYDGRELTLFIVESSGSKRRGELLQADWAAVGVRVKLVALELGELFKRTGRGEHDLTLLSWESDNGDPDNFFTPNLSCAAVGSGGNKARWCDAAFDKLIETARATSDITRRKALYHQAQRLLQDEVGLIPLVHPESTTVVNRRVSGYVPGLFGLHDFRRVSVK